MKRRDFLKKAMASGIGLACAPWLVNAQTNTYDGEFLIVIEAQGAWDITLHMDPKVNQPNELEITHWSNDADIQKTGNVSYAPVINNEHFFKKFQNHLLVINGVDTQTNSHLTGITHSLSGRNAEGYPALPALFSAVKAPHLPFSYLSLNGYSKTSNLILSTRVSGGHTLKEVIAKDRYIDPPMHSRRHRGEMDLVLQAQLEHYQKIRAGNMLPRYIKALDDFETAQKLSPSLDPFMDILPDNFDSSTPLVEGASQQATEAMMRAQIALLAFKGGVASSCTMAASGGFDTHQDNDNQQYSLLKDMNHTIEFIWDYAEEMGIADRLNIVVTSDFSRTPHYNSADGKDHWPTNSYMIMKKNAPWANRVVGKTDEMQNPLKINLDTLKTDNTSKGVILTPSHIHKSLRQMLSIDSHEFALRYPYLTTADTSIFTSSANTL